MRAIILSAGEGSRLRPFTANKPKPMVQATNKPILQHCVEALVANGLTDISIVVGYHRERVQAYFGDGRRFGARITYSFQDVLTGTARALATAPRPDGPFLLVSGDNVVDADLIGDACAAPGDGPAIVAHRSEQPGGYGVLTFDGTRVQRIVEKPREPPSEWVSTGVYRLTSDFHARASKLVEAGFPTPNGIPDLLQMAIEDGVRVEAVKSDALWADALYPWDLLRVHGELLRKSRTAQPHPPSAHVEDAVLVGTDVSLGHGTVLGAGTCVGHHVTIGPGCVIDNSVIYDDVHIGPHSVIRNTVIGSGTTIGPRFTALSDGCLIGASDGWHELDDFGAVVGEDARIGGAVTTMPGTVVGNRAKVAHGRILRQSMTDDSTAV